MKTIPINEIKVDMVAVKSANVASIGHNAIEQILALEFINDTLYYYLDVPRYHYDELLRVPSIGSYLHRNLKGHYRYVRIR